MNYNYGAIKRLKQTEPSLIEAVSFLPEFSLSILDHDVNKQSC